MKWKRKQRQDHILSLIKTGPISFDELLEDLRKQSNPIKNRQLWNDIKSLRESGINGRGILIKLNSDKKYFIESSVSTWDMEDLNDQIRNTLPFVLSLLKPFNYIPAVEYLIKDLDKNHSVSSEKVDQMIVSHNRILSQDQRNAQSTILSTVNTIIDYMKKGNAIEFNYSSVHISKGEEYAGSIFTKVFPLQIRVYEGRYYLLAIPVEKEIEPINIRSYCIDEFYKFMVGIAMDESEENEIRFNWHEMVSKIDIEELFKYCIGIMRPTDSSAKPVIIKRWFKGWAASLVEAAPLHHTQKTEAVKGDEILVSLKVYETPELEYIFGRFREYSWEDKNIN